MPELFTVALVLVLVHTPPGVGSVNAIVEPTHTLVGPDISSTDGKVTIDTDLVATDVPHTLVTVYDITSPPVVTPVTKPPDTVAFALAALHTPPATVLDSVIEDPTHTLEGPLIVPAPAPELMVMIAEEMLVPHAVTTV